MSCAVKGGRHCRAEDIAHWDETEVLGDLMGFFEILNKPEQKRFAQCLGTSVKAILCLDDNEALWALLNEVNYGYADSKVMGFVYDLCAKNVSPKVRKSVVGELATLNLI